ncbi:isochorismate synthase [Nakamurella sp. YIM 132087]|uniref:isochorismate synthase n=1 Tax=Nakamurella alba TaxID=2665158 RepID=A0A7K1FK07_9ACTN|nr:isochorismate synthase [Nakamurella alba]MTD14477.1 isochorismate synthase [Nakamurella alba]
MTAPYAPRTDRPGSVVPDLPRTDPATRVAVTRPLDPSTDLLAVLPAPTGTAAFVVGGDGLVGWGTHAVLRTSGPDAAARIGAWVTRTLGALEHDSDVPGAGPVAFVSLGFDDPDTAVAVIPSVLLGRRDGVAFRTVIGAPSVRTPVPVSAPGRISWSDAGMSAAAFTTAVAAARSRIRAGELEKVVLAHDLEAQAEHPIDERLLLQHLADAYPSCATFAVDGLLGASPELLVRRRGTRISSRVLAGTAWPERSGAAVATELLSSAKDLAEHRFAANSVADTLRAVTAELDVPAGPRPLALANLTHLATDITGVLADPSLSALDVASRLHPTAAVGGTPRDVARQVIRELEAGPRGRYAAPVGWIDAAGDGDFAIALRCAQVSGRTVRLFAGCGVVAGSDPEHEAREAQVKMIPVRDALERTAR